MINICFMGTPKFAIQTLEVLFNEENINIKLVVSQADKKRSRNKFTPTPVKKFALDHNISVITPKTVNDPEFIKYLKDLDIDFIVVVAFGQLIGKTLLEEFKDRIINLHPSTLPKFRGPSPIQFALLTGENSTSATAMLIDKGMDSGDILLQKEVEIEENDDFYSLSDKLSRTGAALIRETVLNFDEIYPNRCKQNDSEATFSKKISKDMGKIDFTKSFDTINNQVRALIDFPKAYFSYKGNNIKVFEVEKVKIDNPKPGFIYEGEDLVIGCKDCGIRIKKLQVPGKKVMATRDFLNGHQFERNIYLIND